MPPCEARGTVRAPPSKSFTHRGLVTGYLTERPHRLRHPLAADDTEATRTGLARMGRRFSGSAREWIFRPVRVPSGPIALDCGESGTTLRFLAAVAALGSRPTRLSGRGRLPYRPTDDLYSALCELGASVVRRSAARALPAVITGPIRPGFVRLRGSVSSQFLSALLMVLPTLRGSSSIRVVGPRVSQPYVEATRAVLTHHRVEVLETRDGYEVPAPQEFRARSFDVPGDASSAAYFWAAAALTGGRVEVRGVPLAWPQPDLLVLDILRSMGAEVHRASDAATVAGPIAQGVDVDLTDAPDLYPLVAVLAATVPRGHSSIRGAPQVAAKESDRRRGTVGLVTAMGARVVSSRSKLSIRGVARRRPLRLMHLTDHRMVMSAAVAALGCTGPSRIGDARVVSKSFPNFWEMLRRVGRPVRSGA